MRKIERYGWRKDQPDFRDHLYAAAPTSHPPVVSLRKGFGPVVDQGQLGSCVSNAVAGALQFESLAQGEPGDPYSRLFIYYEGRVLENSVGYDSGLEVRDGIKVAAKRGAPPETDWAYDIDKYRDKPPANAYNDALNHEAITYAKLSPNGSIRATINSGKPVVFGFSVYDSFESDAVAQSGIVPMPEPGESMIGGHSVVAMGFDDHRRLLECRNSWSTDWGDEGYFWMPYAMFTTSQDSIASDFWVISQVK